MTRNARPRGRAAALPALALSTAAAVLTACGGAAGADRAASSGSPTATSMDAGGSTTSAPSAAAPTDPEVPVQIRITAGDVVLTGTLADNPTAAAFAAQLPLTVPISDHADTEKIFYPPSELSTEGAADGYEPSAGDIAYYSPWGNVVLYYQDFAYSGGLVPMGQLDGDPSALADLPDDTELTIAVV